MERLIDKYDLSGHGDELEQLWTAEGDARKSLRELEQYFNHQLVEQAMAEAGMATIDG